MQIMNDLLAILKNAIDERSVTIAALARRLGCSRQHIYDIINKADKTSVTVIEAELLAEAVGCSITVSQKKTKKSKISA